MAAELQVVWNGGGKGDEGAKRQAGRVQVSKGNELSEEILCPVYSRGRALKRSNWAEERQDYFWTFSHLYTNLGAVLKK